MGVCGCVWVRRPMEGFGQVVGGSVCRGDQLSNRPNELGIPCPSHVRHASRERQKGSSMLCGQWLDLEARTSDSSVGGAASTRGAWHCRILAWLAPRHCDLNEIIDSPVCGRRSFRSVQRRAIWTRAHRSSRRHKVANLNLLDAEEKRDLHGWRRGTPRPRHPSSERRSGLLCART